MEDLRSRGPTRTAGDELRRGEKAARRAGVFGTQGEALKFRSRQQAALAKNFRALRKLSAHASLPLSPRGTSGERLRERGGSKKRTSSPRLSPPWHGVSV